MTPSVDQSTNANVSPPGSSDGPTNSGMPYQSCGGLSFLGECQGTVARWCDGGEIQTVDCASFGQSCGFIDQNQGYYCAQASAPNPTEYGNQNSTNNGYGDGNETESAWSDWGDSDGYNDADDYSTNNSYEMPSSDAEESDDTWSDWGDSDGYNDADDYSTDHNDEMTSSQTEETDDPWSDWGDSDGYNDYDDYANDDADDDEDDDD